MTGSTGRCRAFGCGRELKTPLSRARGYGPDCWAKLHPAPTVRHQLPALRAAGPRPAAGAGQTGPDLLDELDAPAGPP